MKLNQYLALLLSIYALNTSAQLHVIADYGGESAVRFYESLQPDETVVAASPNAIPATLTEMDILPVVSHRLTPGKVMPVSLDLTGMAPIFLIGADNLSIQWLIQNNETLERIHATGLVVNVKTPEELTALRQKFPRLTFIPTPGDDLAIRLNLSHYPALLTEVGLSQ